MNGVQIRIRGKVQGVGFRPFVWQLAQQLGLRGDVCNDGDGVLVRLVGDDTPFLAALTRRCPPLARIDSAAAAPFVWAAPPPGFTIRQSGAGSMRTQIVPDAATCPACLAEMNNPRERRYRYPFINCTHCGPRFTIIRAMPYDRPLTSMSPFPLCPTCATEYGDPADRRFHAQPVACAECGPQLEWRGPQGHLFGEAALDATIARLLAGDIVAVKGLGGFHLLCDAGNCEAVAKLRARKHRPAKPLAVMLATTAGLNEAALTLLTSPAAPIVLLEKTQVAGLCDQIAPGLAEVGGMLPSNPLQHLLSQALARPLVMTSGNLSGRPPALTNAEALADLAGIADGFLLHNREIVQRMDDSVVRQSGEMLR
ncbi:carbamoyltransferase HypF, partial [Klebsiella michiganensis]